MPFRDYDHAKVGADRFLGPYAGAEHRDYIEVVAQDAFRNRVASTLHISIPARDDPRLGPPIDLGDRKKSHAATPTTVPIGSKIMNATMMYN